MRPMPGMVGLISSTSKVLDLFVLLPVKQIYLCFFEQNNISELKSVLLILYVCYIFVMNFFCPGIMIPIFLGERENNLSL